MKTVLIGFGEVGSSLYEVFGKDHEISVVDPVKGKMAREGQYEMMLVTIPYSGQFEGIVRIYQSLYRPECTIIFSSVAIGTSRRLGAVHSPVEGVHPSLAHSIRDNPRWVGGVDPLAIRFFGQSGFKDEGLKVLEEPEWTEFLKLRSTSLYGVNIEFARYTKGVADGIGMPFELVIDYDMWYNAMYSGQQRPEYQRYLLKPPEGDIGGHCVVPNAKILDRQHPNMFLKEIYREKED